MKIQYELNEQDIINTIRNAYVANDDKHKAQIELIHYKDTEGYGKNEHDVDKVMVVIVYDTEKD